MSQNGIEDSLISSCRDLQNNSSLTAIPELSLDLDGLKSIICHPDNVEILKTALEKYTPKLPDFIHFCRPIEIIESEHVNKSQLATKPDGSPKWRRAKNLPDTRFVTWVEDLENPPSWAIYFGLVEQDEEPVFYVVNMGQTWSFNNKPALPYTPKSRRIPYSRQIHGNNT